MACTSPLYRLNCLKLKNARACLPERFYKRIRYDGIVMNYADYKYLVNVHHISKDIIDQIPCGQCIDCRLEKSRQWSIRCMLESSFYDYNYFLTITYAPEYLPVSSFTTVDSGEIFSMPTLVKRDVQLFMKRLRSTWKRKYNRDDIRFFGSGEYSPIKERPHYHFILFNLPIYDLQYFGLSKSGQPLWTSPEIDSIWSKGFVFIGKVEQDSCSYTAKYCLKKVTGKAKTERDDYLKRLTDESGKILEQFASKVDEFTLMSRRPGIGNNYFCKNKDKMYKNDEIFIPNPDGAIKCKPVHYYDRLYDVDCPEDFERIKLKRKEIAENSSIMKLKDANLTDEQYNEIRAKISFRKLHQHEQTDIF